MRGQKVYNEIIRERGQYGTLRKGRSDSLIGSRNEFLFARYYYYIHFKKKCYEDILNQLAAELFLSPATITNIILEHTEQLQLLKKRNPGLYYFQNRWPHLRW